MFESDLYLQLMRMNGKTIDLYQSSLTSNYRQTIKELKQITGDHPTISIMAWLDDTAYIPDLLCALQHPQIILLEPQPLILCAASTLPPLSTRIIKRHDAQLLTAKPIAHNAQHTRRRIKSPILFKQRRLSQPAPIVSVSDSPFDPNKRVLSVARFLWKIR